MRLLRYYIAFTVFRITLEFAYIYFVQPVFSYAGFNLIYDFSNYSISWLVFFVFISAHFFAREVARLYLELFSILVMVPTLILYAYDAERSHLLLYGFSLFYLSYLAGGLLTDRISWQKIVPYTSKQWSGYFYLFIGLDVFIIAVYIASGASLNFNFLDVYEFRQGNALSIGSGLFTYVLLWTVKVTNVILMLLSIIRRKTLIFLISVAAQLLFFGFSGHKSVLVLPLISIGLFYFMSKNRGIRDILILASLIVASAVIYGYLTNDVFAPSMMIRRAFFVPASLNFVYFDFFSQNDFVLWSNSFLSLIVDYPYYLNVAKTIGWILGYDDLSANNGIFASGYAQAGMFGVVFYALLLSALITAIFKATQRRHSQAFIISALFTPLVSTLSSSDLITTFLTHGLIVCVVLLLTLPKTLSMELSEPHE